MRVTFIQHPPSRAWSPRRFRAKCIEEVYREEGRDDRRFKPSRCCDSEVAREGWPAGAISKVEVPR